MELKEKIEASELVSLIWERKEFAKKLLSNSLKNKKNETDYSEGEFQARIILETIDFCLNKILELQTKK